MEFKVHGLEAHAGVCPENGLSAIKIAGDGISRMKLGRIDHETTANLGVIEGGMAVNIVPNLVVLKGEAQPQHGKTRVSDAAYAPVSRRCCRGLFPEREGRHVHARIESKIERDYDRMDVPDQAPICGVGSSGGKKS